MTTAIAPGSLTGSPVYRVFDPTGIHNVATTSTEQGENALGLADASVANGFVTRWNAKSGSAASADLVNANGSGLVLDSLGGLCLVGNNRSDGTGSGGIYTIYGSNKAAVRDSTLIVVCSATARSYGSTGFTDGSERTLCRLGITGGIADIGINNLGQWVVNDWTSGSKVAHMTSDKRVTASTQVLVVRFSAGEVSIQVYANGALTAKATGAAFPNLASGGSHTDDFNGLEVGMGPTAAQGWRGPIRVLSWVNKSLSDSDAAGHAEWCLQQAGLGMGSTTETSALTLVGDSWFAGCYPWGSGSVAGFLAEMLAGKTAVDTIAVPGAVASGSGTGFGWDETSPDRMAQMAALTERFPGHSLIRHDWVLMLGINDSGLAGGSSTAAATVKSALASIYAKLDAVPGPDHRVYVCTIPPCANSSGWATPTLESGLVNNYISAYNTDIVAAYPTRLIDLRVGPFAIPPALGGTWTDAVLEKLTKSTAYQINATSAASTTRLTVEGLHAGRDGHMTMAYTILRKLLNDGRVTGEGALSPSASGSRRVLRPGRR